MKLTTAELNRFDLAIQEGLQAHGAGPFRQQYARRRSRRLGPLCEAMKDRLATRRNQMATDRDALVDEICDEFRDRREEFGVPIWVFAIILKVIASVLIDWWLLRAGESK